MPPKKKLSKKIKIKVKTKAVAKKIVKPASKKTSPKAKKQVKKLVAKKVAPPKKVAIKKIITKPVFSKVAPQKPSKPLFKIATRKPINFDKIAIPQGYIPSEKEEYMNNTQLAYFRKKLLDWRQELLGESLETMEHLKEENWNEPDITDRATVETEAALELRTRDRYRKLIGKIDAALRRIDLGEYGYCEETGDPIGIKRLLARPVATLTIAAQERHERSEKQYNDDDDYSFEEGAA